MSDALLPCPSCSRHVRASEGACPFCATAIPESLRSQAQPRRRLAPGVRLSRAALVALGASTLAAAACAGNPTFVVMYGGPGMDEFDADTPVLGIDGGLDATDDQTIAPMYGAAPTDGGVDPDATDLDATDLDAADADDAHDAAPPKP